MTTAAKRSRSFGWGRIGQPGSNSRERRTQKEGNASEHVYPNGDLSSVWRSFTLLCLSELLKMASWWENGGIPPLAVAELLMTIERRWHSCGSVTQAPTYERSSPPRSPDCPAKPLILRLGGSRTKLPRSRPQKSCKPQERFARSLDPHPMIQLRVDSWVDSNRMVSCLSLWVDWNEN